MLVGSTGRPKILKILTQSLIKLLLWFLSPRSWIFVPSTNPRPSKMTTAAYLGSSAICLMKKAPPHSLKLTARKRYQFVSFITLKTSLLRTAQKFPWVRTSSRTLFGERQRNVKTLLNKLPISIWLWADNILSFFSVKGQSNHTRAMWITSCHS